MMRYFKKYRSVFCLIIGSLLIVTALCVMVFHTVGKEQKRYDAKRALAKVEELLPTVEEAFPEERSKDYMPAMEIDGLNIAGILEVPKYSVKLPLRATWDSGAASALPCRYTGSVYNGTLVIGADGADGQFGCASKMDAGDLLFITDMEGGRYRYAVEKIEHSKSVKDEKLMAGDYDLTVFVKMARGEYLLVRLNID